MSTKPITSTPIVTEEGDDEAMKRLSLDEILQLAVDKTKN